MLGVSDTEPSMRAQFKTVMTVDITNKNVKNASDFDKVDFDLYFAPSAESPPTWNADTGKYTASATTFPGYPIQGDTAVRSSAWDYALSIDIVSFETGISAAVADGNKFTAKTTQVKLMRSVKCECLKLIETFVNKCEDTTLVCNQMVPAMMDPILGDYVRNVPDARDAEVLSLFATIFNKVQGQLSEEVPRVFDAVFQCTLQMITRNFEDYPEHRLKFFELLRAITNHCFRAMLSLSPENLKLVIDSIVWAFRHTERNVAEMGLNLLLEMLQKKRRQTSKSCSKNTLLTRRLLC